MDQNRRRFLALTASAGAASVISGCSAVRGRSQTDPKRSRVRAEELDAVAAEPVLRRAGLDSPIVIESVRLLRKDREYFVHVCSRDGAEGIAVTNDRAKYLYPILNEQMIPYFIGEDARDLEERLFGVYRYQSNYKLQGLALWCPVA
jgi:hypothetical protein